MRYVKYFDAWAVLFFKILDPSKSLKSVVCSVCGANLQIPPS